MHAYRGPISALNPMARTPGSCFIPLLQAIKANNVEKNTLVFVTGDNG